MSNKVSPKSSTVTVKLQFPIEWTTENGKAQIDHVEFRRLKGKHLKKVGKDMNMGDLFDLAAKVAVNDYITPKFFDELDAIDCVTISEVIGDFLDSGQKTGETV